MGLLAILVIVGGMLVITLFAGVWGADPEPTRDLPRRFTGCHHRSPLKLAGAFVVR
jgi:hypothetical protein